MRSCWEIDSSARSVQDKRARSCQIELIRRLSAGPRLKLTQSRDTLTLAPKAVGRGRPAGGRACKGCTHARHFCSFSSMLACTRTTRSPLPASSLPLSLSLLPPLQLQPPRLATCIALAHAPIATSYPLNSCTPVAICARNHICMHATLH